jgi:hypothetical protein
MNARRLINMPPREAGMPALPEMPWAVRMSIRGAARNARRVHPRGSSSRRLAIPSVRWWLRERGGRRYARTPRRPEQVVPRRSQRRFIMWFPYMEGRRDVRMTGRAVARAGHFEGPLPCPSSSADRTPSAGSASPGSAGNHAAIASIGLTISPLDNGLRGGLAIMAGHGGGSSSSSSLDRRRKAISRHETGRQRGR